MRSKSPEFLAVSKAIRIVIGVIGDDIHVVGNRIMHLALEESGCQVFNLRTRNRPEDFCQAALEVNAHAVFVSSLNGEGEHWCAQFRDRMRAVGMERTLLYVGGNVVVGNRPQADVVALFKSYGFDRVYHQQPDIGIAIQDLFEDITRGTS
jgi:methylaspartate mutase sigma subunit